YAQAARRDLESPAVILDNDSSHGDDQLGITRDVNAMAAVLASANLKPPLSVGLFGDWGSGKSFFMHQLRKRIGTLAGESKTAKSQGVPTSFCGDIVQIEFNAWQYMDANIWAAMVTHLFDELNRELASREGAPQNPVDKYIGELGVITDEQRALQVEQSSVTTEVQALDEALGKLKQERDQREISFGEFLKAVAQRKDSDPEVKRQLEEAAKQMNLGKLVASLSEVEQHREELKTLFGKLAAWWKVARTQPRTMVLAIVFVALPFIVATTLSWLQKRAEWSQLSTWIGTAAAAVTSASAFIASILKTVKPAIQSFDRALESAQKVERDVRQEVGAEEQKKLKEREELSSKQEALEKQRADLVKRQAEVTAAIQAAKDAASYKRFINDRAASTDYRSKLGLITTIHRDLKNLSDKLVTAEEPHVDRIVLYIDDLDRCPPDRVVEVLQAVHLLLSLPLFVVVVAVDPGWLLQSLEAYYRKQFGEGHAPKWAAHPLHYLEKIFQVPYSVAPMSPEGFGGLVHSLLGPSVVKRQQAPPPVEPPPAKESSPDGPPAERPEPEPEPAPAPAAPQGSGRDGAPPPSPVDLSPRGLEIEEDELTHLKKLVGLLGSPRAAKRLVNLYRIVRAGFDDEALDDFIAGSYRLYQIFLAAVVGMTQEAMQLFREIRSRPVSSADELAAFMKQQPGERWQRLAKVLGDEVRGIRWEDVCEAAEASSRFSFAGSGAAPPASSEIEDLQPRGAVARDLRRRQRPARQDT
ncbi:MAG TPA: P-loop NTPase fold protein, partial [Myxococcales bacterium]|nr:P-loop NTPase fold protein [Myxococcales bacterium]